VGIQIKRIGHIGILVSDFERSFRFYTEILGMIVTSRRRREDGIETAFLRFGTHHDFVIATAPVGVDVSECWSTRKVGPGDLVPGREPG
jgi:catechol 2,3-dioxygenase-like lactoylglutathione lyase family enzyme